MHTHPQPRVSDEPLATANPTIAERNTDGDPVIREPVLSLTISGACISIHADTVTDVNRQRDLQPTIVYKEKQTKADA